MALNEYGQGQTIYLKDLLLNKELKTMYTFKYTSYR